MTYFEILVFRLSVSGLDKMDKYLQPQHGGSLAAARQMHAGVCVVARVVLQVPTLACIYLLWKLWIVFMSQVQMPNA